MRDLFEYGVVERIWDIFKTMKSKQVIPEDAYLIFDLLGVQSPLKREEVMEFFIHIADSCKSVEEFEEYLLEQKTPLVFQGSVVDISFHFKPVSHVKLSFLKKKEII